MLQVYNDVINNDNNYENINESNEDNNLLRNGYDTRE